MLFLSIAVVILGIVFCAIGIVQIINISDIDVNILLRNPSDYMTSKRDLAIGGLEILVPGIILLLMGVVALTITFTRSLTKLREGRAIKQLERRVSELEKKIQ